MKAVSNEVPNKALPLEAAEYDDDVVPKSGLSFSIGEGCNEGWLEAAVAGEVPVEELLAEL